MKLNAKAVHLNINETDYATTFYHPETGSLVKFLRENEKTEGAWAVVTGKIDAYTVENLNTFLDDNHVLFLEDGTRIKRNRRTVIIFVTPLSNFDKLSPAFVSRNQIYTH